jgi:hypothetical protein
MKNNKRTYTNSDKAPNPVLSDLTLGPMNFINFYKKTKAGILFGISCFVIILSHGAKAQCGDTRVSGILTYCFSQDGASQTSGYMVGFRVSDPTGDTLNVVDLLGNNVTNRGKRIDDINTSYLRSRRRHT